MNPTIIRYSTIQTTIIYWESMGHDLDYRLLIETFTTLSEGHQKVSHAEA
jgi:hypothetical protein